MKSTKIWLAIAGILLVVLGVLCIAQPTATLFTTAWLIGIIFLANNFFVAFSLPVIFAVWVIIEGISIAVESFDYKRVGFSGWWVILLLGICGVVLGVLGLKNPDVSATTLSTLIGLGIIAMGASYLYALFAINKFENKVDNIRKIFTVDDQKQQ